MSILSEWISTSPWLFWLVLAIFFLVIEVATVNLVSIWFVIGAAVACILALLHFSFAVQCLIALVVSLLLIFFFWRMRDRFRLSVRTTTLTNADRIIGQRAVVTVGIDPQLGQGQIRVMGQTWSALSESGEKISIGEQVTVLGLRGVKALVRRSVS